MVEITDTGNKHYEHLMKQTYGDDTSIRQLTVLGRLRREGSLTVGELTKDDPATLSLLPGKWSMKRILGNMLRKRYIVEV